MRVESIWSFLSSPRGLSNDKKCVLDNVALCLKHQKMTSLKDMIYNYPTNGNYYLVKILIMAALAKKNVRS